MGDSTAFETGSVMKAEAKDMIEKRERWGNKKYHKMVTPFFPDNPNPTIDLSV